MRTITSKKIPLVAAVLVLLSANVTVHAATPEQKCENGKKKLAVNYIACRAKAQRNLDARGNPSAYDRDLQKCSAKLTENWDRLETAARADGATCDSTANVSRMFNKAVSCWAVLDKLASPPQPPPARFVNNFDGTITDSQNGLVWEQKLYPEEFASGGHHHANPVPWAGKCSLNNAKLCQPSAAAAAACAAGAEVDTTGCGTCSGGDGTCTEPTTAWSWLVALNQSGFAGHANWRLPTETELLSLVVLTDSPPTIDPLFDGDDCGDTCHDITNSSCACTLPYYPYATATSLKPPSETFALMVDFWTGDSYAITKYRKIPPPGGLTIPRAVR